MTVIKSSVTNLFDDLRDCYDANNVHAFFDKLMTVPALFRDIGAVRCQYSTERALERYLGIHANNENDERLKSEMTLFYPCLIELFLQYLLYLVFLS